MVHVGFEAIASNDLVEMRRRYGPWVDQWVDSVDNELRTLEPHHRRYRHLAEAMAHKG